MLKRTQCKNYSKESKKPIYKRAWLGALAIVIVAGTTGCSDVDNSKKVNSGNVESTQEVSQNNSENTNVENKSEDKTENTVAENKSEDKVEDNIPTEYKSALKQAETYSEMMHMSKAGIYDQLTSEYGGQFTAEAAQYAIDNVEADWKKNALESAKSYQETMSMSPSAIYDQLVSEYGEQFTAEEAQYAIDNLN